jgi:hypothetical protein
VRRRCFSAGALIPGLGFKRIDFAHFCRIVAGKVHAWPHADLKDYSLGQGDLLTNLLDGFWIAEHSNNVGIDTISVEGHRYLRRHSQTDQTDFTPAPFQLAYD